MNVKRLVKQLELDEGIRARVYIDSLGYKTVGIGHMIKDSDPEDIKALKIGDKISNELIYRLFVEDLIQAISDTVVIFADIWDELPSDVQEVFINMSFNLGRTRLLKFKKTIAAVYAKDWQLVSVEMLDSKWSQQVGNRAGRLASRIRKLA